MSDSLNRDITEQRDWRRAKKCLGGNCVEIADFGDGRIGVRNSNYPDGENLAFTKAELQAFAAGLLSGDFDDLLR